ncbi:hypothetical protein C7S18_11035 [Ahniella affigens]|uniref:Lipoprotein n=1 Tax=Ahniella affigens TaxID=2021234 RepID=A0A2P1PS76_9GAMM|nr:hypothetical protein [Ahniella affigens]AVP97699.1 hypothetical protein C7S18_11035 [Ahniella affigens]
MQLRQWIASLTFLGWLGFCGCEAAASPEAVVPAVPVGEVISLSDHESLLTINTLRENFNAHDFVVTFFVVQDRDDPEPQWRLVPVFEQHREQTQLSSRQGADCVLTDFRVAQVDGVVHLWRADRELGEGYADPQPVRVRHYVLERNAHDTPGRPRYYFEWLATSVDDEPACDVGDALAAAVAAATPADD